LHTPDHSHAAITVAAMRAGKHVYVQKPMTHSVYEVLVLSEAAREHKVATQRAGTRIIRVRPSCVTSSRLEANCRP
jgi:FixJ family two-component response regulator